jgi:predicted nuclease with TOPRIM domain
LSSGVKLYITCNNFNKRLKFFGEMKSMDLLESKLKDYIVKNNKFIEDYEELRSEVISLRDKMNSIEDERYNLRKKVETIIDKVEIYLKNSG